MRRKPPPDEISVHREGRCQFCGEWVGGSDIGHFNLGGPTCHGKPRSPYRIGITITRGFNRNLYSLTPEEKRTHAEQVDRMVAQIKAERGSWLREDVTQNEGASR